LKRSGRLCSGKPGVGPVTDIAIGTASGLKGNTLLERRAITGGLDSKKE
jgi:hypothetical protein